MHLPMLDNETLECRYWDSVALEQRTDGCELIESFTNYSVCACDHLTAFSIGKKFKELKVMPRPTLRQKHTIQQTRVFFHCTAFCCHQ
jgi:hypothetical protein